jgi:hypothetical protein
MSKSKKETKAILQQPLIEPPLHPFKIFDAVMSKYSSYMSSKDIDIISKRYGLHGNKVYTLQELGDFYGVSRERVRQLEERNLNNIRTIFLGKKLYKQKGHILSTERENIHLSPSEVAIIQHFKEELKFARYIDSTDLIKFYNDLYLAVISKEHLPLFTLFISSLGGKNYISPRTDHYDLFDFSGSKRNNNLIFDNISKYVMEMLQNEYTPLSFFDIYTRLKKRKINVKKILLRDFLMCHRIISAINLDKYQIKFPYIDFVGRKAYQVLKEAGKPLHYKEIVYEINRRQLYYGKKTYTEATISASLPLMKKELVPISRTGKWALTSWDNVSTKSLEDLMHTYLHETNKNCTVSEIYKAVKGQRPDISQITVATMARVSDKFLRLTDKTYILDIWKTRYPKNLIEKKKITVKKSTIRKQKTKARVECIQKILEEHNGTLPLNVLAKIMKTKYATPTYTTYFILKEYKYLFMRTLNTKGKIQIAIKTSTIIESNSILLKLIQQEESNILEFKPSLRWSHREKKPNEQIELQVFKTIVGFLNSVGGTLIIGVADNKSINGLEEDYKLLSKKNTDGFLLRMNQLIANYIGKEYHANIKIDVKSIDGKDVCIIKINPSSKPVIFKHGDKQEFVVRTNAASESFPLDKALPYISSHFGNGE